jgi:4-oxalocrotonate tautomerase
MPFLHVSLLAGKPPAWREAILDSLYRALREGLGVPEGDRFMVLTEHDPSNFRYGGWPDIARSDDLVYVQITVFDTRTADQKKAFFRRAVDLLGESPGLRPQDVFINVLEAAKENWSLGHGVAQFA